jgi:two-component system, LytTR family, sensor histidine kinase AlgZ
VHPLFADRGRLLATGTLALPLATLVAVFLIVRAGLPTVPALLLALWLASSAIGLLLPVWYICRAVPLGGTPMMRLFATHAAAAATTSAAWMYLGTGAARALGHAFPAGRITALYVAQTPTLLLAGGVLYLVGTAFHYMLAAEDVARRAEKNAIALTVLAREAELRALKAQVHPHFLFNSLNSISALTALDPAKAREMCILLAEFFRKSLAMGERNVVTLDEEWALVRTYLAIEAMRLGERLVLEETLAPAAAALPVPPLLLQPLVENAIRHGVATCPEGGVLRLSASSDGTLLRIGVTNPFDPEAPRRPGMGLGIANVRQRLRAYYGEQAQLLESRGERTFAVEIVIPLEEKKP